MTRTRSTRQAAWVVTVLVSAAPAIVAGRLTGTVPGWLLPVQLAVLVALLPTGGHWPALRPLRRFAVAIAAMLTLPVVVPRWGLQWPALQNLFGGNAFDARMQAEQTAKLLVAAAMVACCSCSGYIGGISFWPSETSGHRSVPCAGWASRGRIHGGSSG